MEVKKIEQLDSYVIPDYQRPYKWRKENVLQLLEDLFENSFVRNVTYRVGSLIVHEDDKGIKNLVDGQQRLTTFALIYKFLNQSNNFSALFSYNHTLSKNNIKYNFEQIVIWFNSKNNRPQKTT